MRRYNCENGGPAPEKLTNQIYQNTTKISQYFVADEALKVDLEKLGTSTFLVQHKDSGKFGQFTVEVSWYFYSMQVTITLSTGRQSTNP